MLSVNAKRARIDAALAGERPDRLPLGLWVHFPEIDDDIEKLARATIDFYERYDLDWIKVTPRMPSAILDWGAKLGGYHPARGFYFIADRPVKTADDWRRLPYVAPDAPAQGEQLALLRAVRALAGPDVPILATLFAPSMMAGFIADDATFIDHLRNAPQALAAGLATVSQTTADFGLACLQNGADGIFYSIKYASGRLIAEYEYAPLDERYDRPVAAMLHARSRLTMLHVHGGELAFDRFADFPCHAVNWYDRVDGPQLDRARARIPDRTLCGGIDHERTLIIGTPADVAFEIADAAAQMHGRPFLLGPGCTVPVVAPADNLAAIRDAVAQSARR
jgi:uroporphyrinogen decarboxylase